MFRQLGNTCPDTSQHRIPLDVVSSSKDLGNFRAIGRAIRKFHTVVAPKKAIRAEIFRQSANFNGYCNNRGTYFQNTTNRTWLRVVLFGGND